MLLYNKKKGQKKATAGDWYILLAQWDKDGKVTSESKHQYGSSTSNKDSKHFNDQVDLFAQNKLKSSRTIVNNLMLWHGDKIGPSFFY